MIATQAVTFAVVVLGPDPRPDGFSVGAAAAALKGEPAQTQDGRPLTRRLVDRPPNARDDNPMSRVISALLARELAGPEFHPVRLELGYPAPRYAARYGDLFGCEVRFDQPQHAMVVDRRWMELPFASYNPVTSRQALALCRAQLTAMSLRGETTAAVERQLRPRLRDNPQMTDVATALHLSERTLRRQLAEEGTSFSAVHDRVRTERALELLQDAETTIASVGSQIGFNDVREFRRAFKRWTGHTPSEARARIA